MEVTDKWLRLGNPWEIPRPEIAMPVKLGGNTEAYRDPAGRDRVRWVPHRLVLGVAYDTPILGYEVTTANLLRLWKAEACESFDFEAFNLGDYYGAVEEKIASENITKVLYPNDNLARGKELRLEQQYFFVSCSLQDMIRIHLQTTDSLDDFHQKYAVQLNDTHPALAVPELMRLFVDEHGMPWERAWDITRQSFGYTNHTLLPEALETWPVALFEALLAPPPRDRLRDQPALPRRGARPLPRGRRARPSALAHRRERRVARCAWQTSPRWGATRSTASPRSTPSC